MAKMTPHRWSLLNVVGIRVTADDRPALTFKCDLCGFFGCVIVDEDGPGPAPKGWCGVPGLGEQFEIAGFGTSTVVMIDAGLEVIGLEGGTEIPISRIAHEFVDGRDRWFEVVT